MPNFASVVWGLSSSFFIKFLPKTTYIEKLFLPLLSLRAKPCVKSGDGHIFDESVFAFIPWFEIWKISMLQGEQHTRHLVLVHVGHFLCPTPIRVWGIVYL